MDASSSIQPRLTGGFVVDINDLNAITCNYMKKKVYLAALGLAASISVHATSFTLNGTAINNAPGINDDIGNTAVWLVNDSGAFSAANFATLDFGLSLSTGQLLNGYEIAGTNSVVGGGGNEFVFGIGLIDVTADASDGFGLLVFDNSTTDTQAGDSYTIYSDSSWFLPSAGSSITFGGSSQPDTLTGGGVAGFVNAVPEPSSAAVLIGTVALGFVATRRRKA